MTTLIQAADLQECNLTGSYLGQRPRAVVTHGGLWLLNPGRRRARGGQSGQPGGGHAAPSIDLTLADLFHADLTNASLRGGVARDAVFYTAIARNTVFEGAHLEGADFRQAELEGARFTGSWIEGARFRGAVHVPPDVARLLDTNGDVPAGYGMPVPPPEDLGSVPLVSGTRSSASPT